MKVNQMLYGQIACYQGMENSSRTAGFSNALSSASWIGKGLQGVHAYPAEFGRAQDGGGGEILSELGPLSPIFYSFFWREGDREKKRKK